MMSGWAGHEGCFKEKNCAQCGVKFKQNSGRQNFCSKVCRRYSESRRDYMQTEKQYYRVNKTPRHFFVRLIHGRGRGAAGSRSALTPELLMEMFKAQNGRCAISGSPMDIKLKLGGSWFRCSVDRKDNIIGYVPENIHLVCKGVNVGRNAQSLNDFIKMCKTVTEYQEKQNGSYYEGTVCKTLCRVPGQAGTNKKSQPTQPGQSCGGETSWL